MKAYICVDYLSHDWNADDLILARRELQKQKSKTIFDLTTKQSELSSKELKKLSAERIKQIRYENALWRQMNRKCTRQLSYGNAMVNPSTVNWQKDSDITWLYGPLYIAPEADKAMRKPAKVTAGSTQSPSEDSASTAQLKSALKYDKMETEKAMLNKDYWCSNNRYWSKCASEAGKQSVRFNPDIVEVSYVPDSPVKPSMNDTPSTINNDYSIYNYADDDMEDEQLWDVLTNVGSYLRTFIFTNITPSHSKLPYKPIKITPNPRATAAATSIYQSTVSLTSWLLYKGANTIVNRALGTAYSQPMNDSIAK